MKLSVYLDKEIITIIRCYGDQSEVINKCLDAWEAGLINIEDAEYPGPRDGCSKYTFDITNEAYLNLLSVYGTHNPRYSLRRIIYYIVDNELFDVAGLIPIHKYVDPTIAKIRKRVQEALASLQSALIYDPNNSTIQEVCTMLKELL